ncbi:MAG: Pvc16 family protein [Gaiellaceae bacterium]
MSNSLAIATTTVVLGDIVQSGLGAVTGAMVTNVRPDEKDNGAPSLEANVFLYQVTPNAALRNADLPTRTANGDLRRRPQLGLDLHYLVSFYGDEAILEPQRLLGGAVSALHARPVVTGSAIQAIIDASTGADLTDPRRYLGDTDLFEQVERVSFTPLALNLEELSKLWSTLFGVPYVLSVVYEASVVLVEAQVAPKPALPVRLRNVYVLPIERPLVESVAAEDGPDEPILPGTTIVVRGTHLRGDVTRLRVGETIVAPAVEEVGETEIRAALEPPLFPPGTLRAGVQGAQVVHLLELGTPPEAHRGFESNVAPFVLRSTLTSTSVTNVTGSGTAPRSATATVVADPPIGKRQRVLLLLYEVAGGEAYSFQAPTRELDTDPVEIRVEGVAAGTYLVRIQVDGAESPLEVETAPGPNQGRFVGPTVAIP